MIRRGYMRALRLEVDQQVGHPGSSQPNAEITCEGAAGTPDVTPTVDVTPELLRALLVGLPDWDRVPCDRLQGGC